MKKNTEVMMSSSGAFILAISGAAIGIGSIWRMPYMIGNNGGSIFILFYLFFLCLLGLPVMISEIVIGKLGRKPPIDSLKKISILSDSSEKWGTIGILGTFGSIFILSFYCVVSGWAIYYFCYSFWGLQITEVAEAEIFFGHFQNSPWKQLICSVAFLLITMLVSAFRIDKGIEKLNDILMPLLYLILLGLMVYALLLPGFYSALYYLFHPDWSKLNFGMIFNAMGMAFFTLATGACCLVAYGAYIPEKQSITKSTIIVAILNLSVALCTGIVVFSIVFSYGMDASSGPGLVFMALPVALYKMPFGNWIMPIFFFLLVIACWTSSVNLAEPLVTAVSHRLNCRKKGAIIAGIIVWIMSLVPAFSFNLFSNVNILGYDLFTFYTMISTDVLLPITGFLTLFFVGFIMKKSLFLQATDFSKFGSIIWYGLIRYISPLCLLLIFLFTFYKVN